MVRGGNTKGDVNVARGHTHLSAADASGRGRLMSPIDVAFTALLAVSFVLSLALLAAVTLILEALLFALGLGRRDWTERH